MKQYFIVLEGEEPKKAFTDFGEADCYANDLLEKNLSDTKEEYGYQDDFAALYQNGYDGGSTEVVCVDFDEIDDDQDEYTVATSTGDVNLCVTDILDLVDEIDEDK